MVKEEKLKQVEELKKMIESYSVIGILDMHKVPSKQMQQIAKKIRGQAVIKMTKKSILKFALKEVKKTNIQELEKNIPQQPALIFTNSEPFKIYSAIDKMKSSSAAKEGDVAPNDIMVFAGPTNLLPGPAISELSKAGIPAGVEEGKIAVKKDIVVAKKGDKISKALASALRKLNIEPMLVGLNIVALFSEEKIYKKDILDLVNVYPEQLKQAYNQALNLSVSIGYPTKDSIRILLAKAYQNAIALGSKIGGVS